MRPASAPQGPQTESRHPRAQTPKPMKQTKLPAVLWEVGTGVGGRVSAPGPTRINAFCLPCSHSPGRLESGRQAHPYSGSLPVHLASRGAQEQGRGCRCRCRGSKLTKCQYGNAPPPDPTMDPFRRGTQCLWERGFYRDAEIYFLRINLNCQTDCAANMKTYFCTKDL